MTYEYSVRNHGDLLERKECYFIESHLPAYEEIWKRYIGHQGNGRMAEMKNISEALNEQRAQFAQHHYTVLESLVLMREIVDDPLLSSPVHSIIQYYKILNLIMSFQAHAGRVRDNLKNCYDAMGMARPWDKAKEQLQDLWHSRNIFIHGCKVPFMLDEDRLFKSADTSKSSTDTYGYKMDGLWKTKSVTEMTYLHDQLSQAYNELTYTTNNLLEQILSHIKSLISSNSLHINPPNKEAYPKYHISSSMDPQGERIDFFTASGNPTEEYQ